MPSDEEKEAAGREKAESEAAERELTDQFADEQAPAETGSSVQESEEEEPEAEETPEEKKKNKEKKFWLLSLGLILLLLVGGGFYAVTGMRQAAHKLGGGSDYDQLSANSSIYDGGAGAAKNADYFPLDEDAARAQAAKAAGGGRINAALIRTQAELVAEANGKRTVQETAAANTQEETSPDERAAGTAPAGQAAMAEKLQARAFLSGGAMSSRSSKNSAAAAPGGTGAFQGNGTVVGRATAQGETKSSTPKGASRGSVMEGLKSAFKASFYGARLSSQDSAKGWIARSFDGTAEATTAIEYEDKMRSKLDKVNPDSIPGFLREQDVSAAEAKTLTTSEVAKPKMDKEGTKEALAEDKEYQAKKIAKDFSGSMINGLFAGLSGDGPPEDKGGPGGDDPGDMDNYNFVNPDDYQEITDEELQTWVDTNGFGGECGCTEEAPCCCMPNSGDTGAGDANIIWAGPDVGDFSGDSGLA